MTSARDQETQGEGDARLKTLLDPAVGTGRMLLRASNYSYCLYGCDIDPLMVTISEVNGAFYAPWMAFLLEDTFRGVSVPPPPPGDAPCSPSLSASPR